MWKNILFSDEFSIKQFPARKYRVWRPHGARCMKKFITQTAKHPPSQIIWGDMSPNGRTDLYFLPSGSKMIGYKYVELHKEKLVPHMDIRNCTIWMPDGAPCHKNRLVQQFLDSQLIKMLDWPRNSSDLYLPDNTVIPAAGNPWMT